MKAAAEAWGSTTGDFKRGFAKQTDDPAIVAVTMAKPSVVLRRPVGSKAAFTDHAKLPNDLPVAKARPTTKEPPPQARRQSRSFEKTRNDTNTIRPVASTCR